MKEISIKLTNAFGIGEFDHQFNISEDDNVIMIYAPNGTMKTSLTKTFLCLEEKLKPQDFIVNSRKTTWAITIDGEDIRSGQIYVYKSNDLRISGGVIPNFIDDNIAPLISSPKLYQKFIDLQKPLIQKLNIINEKFSKYANSKTFDFSKEVLKVYRKEDQEEVLDIPSSICELYKDSKFRKVIVIDGIYSDLFDINDTTIKYIRDNTELLLQKGRKRKPRRVDNKDRWIRLCEYVDQCEYIRSNINDIDTLRKGFLCDFAQKEITVIEDYVRTYDGIRSKLLNIIREINKDNWMWKEVISTFNNRFNVPYKIKIVNKSEVVLKRDSFIHLGYDYDDGIESSRYLSEDHFLNFISSGEKRAYYLLLNLFGIERRKNMQEMSVLVFDDIVESFDYKNKYAFVEYLADLKKEKNFVIILLTHNFDFFRTVHSRLNVKNVFMAERNKDRIIKLHPASYLRDIIKNKLIANISDPKFLISLVPFVRNIVEYTKGSESEEYIKLTSYVHVKNDTDGLTVKGLISIISSIIHISKKCRLECDSNYLDKLVEKADNVCNSTDDIALENKLVLSIAIRILAEKFMIKELNRKAVVCDCKDNQTFRLFKKYEEMYSDNHEIIKSLRKVIMMTSENIHLNNFMFEPIIDLSCAHLKELYLNVKSLLASELSLN